MRKIIIAILLIVTITNGYLAISTQKYKSMLKVEDAEMFADAELCFPWLPVIVVGVGLYAYYKSNQEGTYWVCNGTVTDSKSENYKKIEWECQPKLGTNKILCSPVGNKTYTPFNYINPNGISDE